jgi:hypothetical protein
VLGATPTWQDGKDRTALAHWMGSRDNPLVSRVWVNRLWGYHFGRGIVPSTSDLGTMSQPPSHPELLDWLAVELMENRWSTKHIHRLITLSSTYRQASRRQPANDQVDPDNQWLWRWRTRRLEAEAIRDSTLVATGELDDRIGGPSVPPAREEQELRRTLYLYQRRSEMPSVMSMFDAPDGIVSCARREVSTVALQPLYLLNSQYMTRRAASLAKEVREIAGEDRRQQVTTAFQRTLGRAPEPVELSYALNWLESTLSPDGPSPLQRLCHGLMNLNEFLYIP